MNALLHNARLYKQILKELSDYSVSLSVSKKLITSLTAQKVQSNIRKIGIRTPSEDQEAGRVGWIGWLLVVHYRNPGVSAVADIREQDIAFQDFA